MEHGFTMVPNYVFAHLLTLPASQLKVLLFILRRTLGWHRTQDKISLSQFEDGVGDEDGTGLSRSSIISAIEGLKTQGLVLVSRMSKTGPNLFRLGPLFTVAVDPAGPTSQTEQAVAGKSGHEVARFLNPQKKRPKYTDPSSSDAPEAAHDDDFRKQRETKLAIPAPVPIAGKEPTTPPVELQPLPVSTAKAPGDPPAIAKPAVEQAFPIAQLMAFPLGFSQRTAERILTDHPLSQVQAALGNVPYRKAKNPAGYFLCELRAGDYALPTARSKPPHLYVLPAAASVELTMGAKREADVRHQLQEAIAELDPATRADLLLEARRQHARLAGKPLEKIAEDSMLVMGRFENLVLDRLQASAVA